MNSTRIVRLLIFGLIGLALASIIWSYLNGSAAQSNIPISELAQQIKTGQVANLRVADGGRQVTVTYKASNVESIVQISSFSSLEEVLEVYGVDPSVFADSATTITYDEPSPWSGLLSVLSFVLPIVIVFVIFYFLFYRQLQGGSNQAMAFGKSKARMFNSDKPTVTFDDVAGADESKADLQEVVSFLREPEKFINFGARIPKGVLLIGRPGTGKTLLAKAVAGEAGVPFFSLAGSEFVEMFVGVGASRVRDLFEQAKRHSPCIVFIDEIDAVGRQRGAGLGGSHDEREQTLNQILVEMDGFDTDTHIIMLAATNRPDILDAALTRPGRFDRRVVMDSPDVKGREQIFRVHMRGKPIANDVDVSILGRSTPGFVGADIENMVNEAALLAARRNKKAITMDEMQEALERVQLGPERRSRVMSDEARTITAYHEAGHAIVAHLLPHSLPLRKVTIVPRGMAGGVTWYMMEDNIYYQSTEQLKAKIATALGGRVAEEVIFGDATTGAQADLSEITRVARSMVTQYGMGKDLSLRVYGKRQEMVFLGREISEQRDYSDALAEKIDEEVNKIIDEQYAFVQELLTRNRDKLDLIANTLLKVETLEADEFASLMETGELPSPAGPPPSDKTPDESEKPEQKAEEDGKNWSPPKLDLPPSPSPA